MHDRQERLQAAMCHPRSVPSAGMIRIRFDGLTCVSQPQGHPNG